MTLFPATVDAVLHESIIGRAAKKGIVEINCVQIRDYTENKQNQVDDYPYGGGFGCVMMAQPLKSCLDAIKAQTEGMRRRQQLERTKEKRPDMYEKFEPQDETDRKLMKDVERSDGRIKLTEKLQCVPAEKEDVDRIMEIVDYARRSLRVLNVDQWQGDYPDRATFEGDIERGELYKLMHGGDLAGFFMLSDREEPTYADITDGKWSSDAPYCVMHRSAIAEEYRGNGMSGYLIKCVEELTRSHGRRYVRIDTHRNNKPMQKLLRSSGYRYRGNILITGEPGHDPHRQAFEKILKDKK